MQIYWIKAQAPRRVLALVKHLGIEAQCIELDLMGGGLKTPAYTALNPNRKVPTLVDGDTVLWESSAIMAYLCIKHGSDMWPAHDPRRTGGSAALALVERSALGACGGAVLFRTCGEGNFPYRRA